MVEIILVARDRGPYSGNTVYYDKALKAGAIAVDVDAYAAPLDRVFNVNGNNNMHVEYVNDHATNGLIYKIEKARKEFTKVSELTDADFDRDILGNTTVLALVSATATITLATVLAGSTVTINGLVYTAVAGVKANFTQFSIDGSDTVDAADLADSINNDTRVGTLKSVTAIAAVAIITLTSTAVGAAGNAVTLAEDTGASTITISGPTFSGGVNNFDIRDIENISPETTAIRIRVKRQTAGDDATLAGIVSVN